MALCDTSGSMDAHARFLIAFLLALKRVARRTEIFVFNTRPDARSRRGSRRRPVAQTLDRLAAGVPDWSGGTRIGECLDALRPGLPGLDGRREDRRPDRQRRAGPGRYRRAGRRDAGDPIPRARRVLWLNPLLSRSALRADRPRHGGGAPVRRPAAARAQPRVAGAGGGRVVAPDWWSRRKGAPHDSRIVRLPRPRRHSTEARRAAGTGPRRRQGALGRPEPAAAAEAAARRRRATSWTSGGSPASNTSGRRADASKIGGAHARVRAGAVRRWCARSTRCSPTPRT